MATPPLVGLVYHSSQPHSHHEIRLVFVSRNEKAICSLKDRLSLFCLNHESFSVVLFGYPDLVNGKFRFITESYSDYDYCLHIDTFDIEFKKTLLEDQYINEKEVVTNPTISEINQFCQMTWGFNDYKKRLSLLNRIAQAKETGEYWSQKEAFQKLENLL